jgi:hypothetical protein
MNQTPTRLLADIESPWNHFSRRFIDAPIYRLKEPFPPHPLANYWRLELKQDGARYIVENDQPILDTVEVWPKLRVGTWIQATIFDGDRPGRWWIENRPIGVRLGGFQNHGLIAKAPDWMDHDEAPMDYVASVQRNRDWLDGLEQNPNAYYREPGMPAWWWHAGEDSYPAKQKFEPGAFPSLASIGIHALLLTAKVWPERAAHCRDLACRLGDWHLKNRTPMTGAIPGMPISAMREGKFEYSIEADNINLSRGSFPAFMFTELYRETGEKKYLERAQYIAGMLFRYLGTDGSMPYRVKPSTGEVVEEYTCGHIWVGQFMDALDKVAPDPRWKEASARIVRWVIEHPLRDYDWKACFEDAWKFPPFSSMACTDALVAVRLFCRHGETASARKLFRWVEDQFVNFGDEASLVVSTYYPTVREQTHCDFPMEAHGANYASACWELHRATGDAIYRRKGIATLNAIVKSQRADGAYSTWGIDRDTGISSKGNGGNWFNCSHMAAAELCSFVLQERGEDLLSF